jgi:ABC-type uncharacterized transport system YnjBCD ATPase subunit
MLKVDKLKKSFGSFEAVKGISFEVAKGEVLGFLGPNGAGKSTTMRMITGFIPPTSGTAEICGHDITTDPVGAKGVLGYLPESAPSYRAMTVCDFLAFIAKIRGYRGAEAKERVEKAIVDAKLTGVARDDAAVRTGGHDLGKIRAALLGQRLGAGRNLQIADNGDGSGNFFFLSSGGFGGRSGLGSSSGGFGSGSAAIGIKLSKGLALIADDHHVGQAGNVVALREENRKNSAFIFCFLIESSFVGLVGEQDVAHRDFVTDLLSPLSDNAAFHRLTLSGHNYRYSHKHPPVTYNVAGYILTLFIDKSQ